MTESKIQQFPKTRIATIDICAVGLQKHYIPALIEMDITVGREKIRQYKNTDKRISFTAWLIKVISRTIKDYEPVASYLNGKRNIVIFKDVNVSIIVEKNLRNQKVPIPLVIEKANERSVESITQQIDDARSKDLTENDIVLQRRSSRLERLYYILPGFIRRFFWRYLLRHPHWAYSKMGNVSLTSIGMMGSANGWFIPRSVHPVCFGIGRITKKPVVINGKIEIREILNMTVLLDHDVADGALMARFIGALSENIEKGVEL